MTRLYEEINKQRYTQTYISKLLNVNKMTVHYWVIGKFIPNKESCIALSNLLDVSIDELFYKDGDRNEI